MTLSIQATQLLEKLEQQGVRLGLESARKLLTAFGQPERELPAVLIAGTNGKGATATFLAAMVAAAGYKTGLYTSPHLQEVRERIRINGLAISNARLERELIEVVEVSANEFLTLPTYFEALTAAAFKIFFDEKVDLAVIEVGLGGRLDATNLANPLVSLITEVGLEHQEFLGSNISAIAREKGGILRAGKPAFAWTERPEVWESLQQVAREVGANLILAQESVKVTGLRPVRDSDSNTCRDRQAIRVSSPSGDSTFTTRLLGRHQLANLGLAVVGAEELREIGFAQLNRKAMVQGVATCNWPGRLERVCIPGKRPILLDAAHNPDGARTLIEYLKGLGEPYDLLFGTLADKDVDSYFPNLAAKAERVILTGPANSRALRSRGLGRLAAEFKNVVIEEDLGAALRLAVGEPIGASGQARLLVVCGSIYLVGEVRTWLQEQFSEPLSAGSVALFDRLD